MRAAQVRERGKWSIAIATGQKGHCELEQRTTASLRRSTAIRDGLSVALSSQSSALCPQWAQLQEKRSIDTLTTSHVSTEKWSCLGDRSGVTQFARSWHCSKSRRPKVCAAKRDIGSITYNFHVNVDSGKWDGNEGVVTALFTVQLYGSPNLTRILVNVQVGVYRARLCHWWKVVLMMVMVVMVFVVHWLLRWLWTHSGRHWLAKETTRHWNNEKRRLHGKWSIAGFDDANEGAHWYTFRHPKG